MSAYILGVDQGTTGTKAILLDENAGVAGVSDRIPVEVHSPALSRAEQNPQDLLNSVTEAIASVLRKTAISISEIKAMGLGNQGETVIAFDRKTGDPIFPAISWMDKRNSAFAADLMENGSADFIRNTTGLRPDPYFSAFKMKWILENIPEAMVLAKKNRLCMATSDTWLHHKLTGSDRPVSDCATASRTMLLNLDTLDWDDELLAIFSIPGTALPEIVSNDSATAELDESICGKSMPLNGLCVDQQAALFGQRCFSTGDAKATYGTGCFVQSNQGSGSRELIDGLLTSVGWRVGDRTTFVYDGGIYAAGSLLEWLIGSARLCDTVQQIDHILADPPDPGPVFFNPALHGLAAPYWLSSATGSWTGLSASTTREDLVYTAVESICFRVRDVVEAMGAGIPAPEQLRVDGGMAKSEDFVQLQADVLGMAVEVFENFEATAYGTALFAGIGCDMWNPEDIPGSGGGRFVRPNPGVSKRLNERYGRWKEMIKTQIEAGYA